MFVSVRTSYESSTEYCGFLTVGALGICLGESCGMWYALLKEQLHLFVGVAICHSEIVGSSLYSELSQFLYSEPLNCGHPL